MHWFETQTEHQYGIEVASLSFTYKDRERIGRVLSLSDDIAIIQTKMGHTIKWADGKLLKVLSLPSLTE